MLRRRLPRPPFPFSVARNSLKVAEGSGDFSPQDEPQLMMQIGPFIMHVQYAYEEYTSICR